jgi:LuxR family maltose regulon positive regulatory protein
MVATKFFVPRPRPRAVPRRRLIERLQRGLDAKLTLVSAPPGFGKTTLLAEWLAGVASTETPAVWVQLEPTDSQPAAFWTCAVTALQSARPGVGDRALAMLQAPNPGPSEPAIASLLNDLASSAGDVMLVLDDYHVIEDRAIHEGLAYLLDHAPRQLRLVIASRADPPLPLSPMRVRGELVEVRAADLRFSGEEAGAFLNGTMRLDLAEEQVAALESRTEGWAAALQLAGLSIQGRDDVSGFIADFAGDNRYIVDYLVEEALQQQPEDVRNFLLRTAILDRLGAGLCEAVTGMPDAGAILRYLEERNVFVVPLDERRQWFRYHHLFADVLRARLAIDLPGEEQDLHRRASAWFAAQGEAPLAIRHAFAANDFEAAAALVERVVMDMLRTRQEEPLRSWIARLPAALVRRRPVLAAGYAGALMHGAFFEAAEPWLRDAEAGLETAVHVSQRTDVEPERPVYVDEQQFREQPGMIALYRAGHAQASGDLSTTARYARLALELMAPEEPLRGGALALLGLAHWSAGDIEEARKTYLEGIAIVHDGGYVHDNSLVILTDLLVAQGRLREARDSYGRAIAAMDAQGSSAPRGAADLLVGLAEILREQGDLAAAAARLDDARELGDYAALPETRFRWFTAMAGVKRSEGGFDAALSLLDEAERLYTGSFSPDVRPISALRARTWIDQGKPGEASAWARGRGISATDEISYLREFEHLTLVRLLIARARNGEDKRPLDDAAGLLARLLTAAETGGRTNAVIQILALQALVAHAHGDPHSAMQPLRQALSLAEPEGFVRVFLDEGAPMTDLLQAIAIPPGERYAGRLLGFANTRATPEAAPKSEHETLSERELDVLRLLASDLSGPGIAGELVISLNTLRTHTKNVYGKLGVNSRRAAVRRAIELRLL